MSLHRKANVPKKTNPKKAMRTSGFESPRGVPIGVRNASMLDVYRRSARHVRRGFESCVFGRCHGREDEILPEGDVDIRKQVHRPFDVFPSLGDVSLGKSVAFDDARNVVGIGFFRDDTMGFGFF